MIGVLCANIKKLMMHSMEHESRKGGPRFSVMNDTGFDNLSLNLSVILQKATSGCHVLYSVRGFAMLTAGTLCQLMVQGSDWSKSFNTNTTF